MEGGGRRERAEWGIFLLLNIIIKRVKGHFCHESFPNGASSTRKFFGYQICPGSMKKVANLPWKYEKGSKFARPLILTVKFD